MGKLWEQNAKRGTVPLELSPTALPKKYIQKIPELFAAVNNVEVDQYRQVSSYSNEVQTKLIQIDRLHRWTQV